MKKSSFAVGVLSLSLSAIAFGQTTTPPPKKQAPSAAVTGVSAYPTKNQSASKQEKDKLACSDWATEQTGIDPNALTATSQSTAGKSAVKGGAVGTGVGILTGNPLAGAAIGAGTGAAVGHGKKKSQEQASIQQQKDSFAASYSACLDGKGYTTKRTGQ